MSEFSKTTIVFPLHDNEILLGMKKRGFGEGWWNGFGGKLDDGESFEDSARRETLEEVGLEIATLQPVARLLFYFVNYLEVVSKVYLTHSFAGNPRETEEMKPQWFKTDRLPFESMWPADKIWVPQIINSKPDQPLLELAIHFDKDNEFIKTMPADPDILGEAFGKL